MPHLRERFIYKIIEQKLKFAPVFALQGARQTGKSYLAREIIAKRYKNSKYLSFDQKSIRSFAEKRPDTFIEDYIEYCPIIIDEAQKVPDIFDAIKFRVDQKRVAGQFFILGSTEFSKLNNIRESLTGRMSRARLFPLTIRESLSLKNKPPGSDFFLEEKPIVTKKEFLRYIKNGGMPGIFTVKNESERTELLKDWITLTVERDIHTFSRYSLSSDIALEIIIKIATLAEPNLANIAKALRKDRRSIKKHIEVLSELFCINTLNPHPLGTGKDLYFIVDTALAQVLGADFERLIYTTALNELLAKQHYFGDNFDKLYYYRNSKGNIIHFVKVSKGKELSLLKIISNENYDERDFELLYSFKKKHPDAKLYSLAPSAGQSRKDKMKIYSWESLA